MTKHGRIDLVWSDVCGWDAARWQSCELKALLLDHQPHLVINDRLPDEGDYDATAEGYVPLVPPADDWWETGSLRWAA